VEGGGRREKSVNLIVTGFWRVECDPRIERNGGGCEEKVTKDVRMSSFSSLKLCDLMVKGG